ncbi:YDG domain-containing protein, partial [Acinetobacter silvestris]
NASSSLMGTNAGNYELITNGSVTANISKKQITGAITAQDKVYDGTTNATVNGSLNGVITGDQVNLNAQGQFTNKNAGQGKDVTVSGSLTGTDAGNYQVSTNTTAKANITKAKAQVIGNSLTTSFNGQQQHVDGFTVKGLVNGETTSVLTGVTATGASATAEGTYSNTVSGEDQNYELMFTAGMLKIQTPLIMPPVTPEPPTVPSIPEQPNQPNDSIWGGLLDDNYQRAIHFAPKQDKPKRSDDINIEVIGDGINMDGIHTFAGNF